MGFFEDYRGEQSWGRLAASYCIVVAVLIFLSAYFLPHLASYCQSVGGSLLLTAGSLYLTSKGEQGISTITTLNNNSSSIKALLGIKDAVVAPPETTTPPSEPIL